MGKIIDRVRRRAVVETRIFGDVPRYINGIASGPKWMIVVAPGFSYAITKEPDEDGATFEALFGKAPPWADLKREPQGAADL